MYHFCHEGESAAVVEVKVGDDDAVDVAGEGVAAQPGALLLLGDVAEVGEAALVLEPHVHPAVEHDVLAADVDQQTRPPHVLPRPKGRHFDLRHTTPL